MNFVVDTSVVVKWYDHQKELYVSQAKLLLDRSILREIKLTFPDLIVYELTNALLKSKGRLVNQVKRDLREFLDLQFDIIHFDQENLERALQIADECKITVYDSMYVVLAEQYNCPLVTANPRHQAKVKGVDVIPIEEYK